ncbi:hypothetical protein ATN79_47905 [Paraburkholderia caribensis]|nr:hypothetical protein ATN79_47905 [Paraburkholderia caribensis]
MVSAGRETLVVSVARSFADCVLCRRIGGFAKSSPRINLRIDVHRYFVDLDSSGVDISIQLGSGPWDGYRTLAISDDRIGAVCSPQPARHYAKLKPFDAIKEGLLLRNVERTTGKGAMKAEIVGHKLRPQVRVADAIVDLAGLKSWWGKLRAYECPVHHSTIFELNVESYRPRSADDNKRARAAKEVHDLQQKIGWPTS